LHILETINHNFVASIFLGEQSGIKKWRDELENLFTALTEMLSLDSKILSCVGDGLHVAQFGEV